LGLARRARTFAGVLKHILKPKSVLLSALAACWALAVAAPMASASDPGACARNGRTIAGMAEYQCTLWRGNVPVYGSYSTDPNYGGRVVGYLYAGGRANWFTSQCRGNKATLVGYWNYWWAYTLADNGRWGYVPLTYFDGGANDQRSATLPLSYFTGRCGGGSTHPS